jgi:hypothetical protein
MLEPQGDNWAGGNARESGPVISKWEQLSLAPELLRSLGKFGSVFSIVFFFFIIDCFLIPYDN